MPRLSVILLVLLLTSCRDREIQAYRAPKDPTPAPMAAAPGGAQAMAQQTLPGADQPAPPVSWAKPEGWTESPGNQVRVATFTATQGDRKAELSITQFPGDVGGDLANVNRWRGQVQLQAINEADLPSAISTFEAPAGAFKLIDIQGTETLPDGKAKQRILGVWIKHQERTWFFKFMGPSDIIDAEKAHFEAFVRSIQFK